MSIFNLSPELAVVKKDASCGHEDEEEAAAELEEDPRDFNHDGRVGPVERAYRQSRGWADEATAKAVAKSSGGRVVHLAGIGTVVFRAAP